MKNVLLLLIAAVCLTGCMHSYDIMLVNGMRVTHVSRPKLDKESGSYIYKDVRGETHTVSATKVVEIAPHSDKNFTVGGQK